MEKKIIIPLIANGVALFGFILPWGSYGRDSSYSLDSHIFEDGVPNLNIIIIIYLISQSVYFFKNLNLIKTSTAFLVILGVFNILCPLYLWIFLDNNGVGSTTVIIAMLFNLIYFANDVWMKIEEWDKSRTQE